MSIASRISAMQEHLRDDYDVLNLAGADLTNVDKNIVNLKPTWKERLLYFMNNGTDEVWNNWDKVTGEGEEISLNNTLEAKMGIELKGNTYQNSTTGKNLIDYSMVDVNYTQLYDTGYYKLAFPGNKKILEGAFKENTQYTLSFMGYRPGQDGNGGGFNIVYTDSTQDMIRVNTTNPSSYSITSKANKNISYIFVTWGSTNISYLKDLQLEEGSQATSYEPYTNGASPNPSYPQDIHTVSGDNTITICGKNLIDTIEYNRGINSSGVISGVDTHYLGISDYVFCKPSTTYTITFEHDISTLSLYIGYKDKDGNFINRVSSSSRTFKTPNNAYYMFVYVYKDDRFTTAGGYVQLEYGSTATTYEPYQSKSYSVNLGSLELCKIGNYQDYLYKDSGKWYKYSAIGKKVLDGSESWAFRTDWTLTGASVFKNSGYVAGEFETGTEGFSNYLIVVANIGSLSSYHHIRVTNSNGYGTQIFMDNDFLGITSGDTDAQKTAKLKTWLGNNNTTFYGIKPTPTTEEITDSTLLSQLNALAKSYEGQTNISQENNDLASILNATALEEME